MVHLLFWDGIAAGSATNCNLGYSVPNRTLSRIWGLVLEFSDSTVRLVGVGFQGPSK
jgi:hypothetical protein